MSNATIARLVKKDIREKRTSLIIYCLAGAATIWLYVAMFPSLQQSAKDISKVFNSIPKELLKAFGAEGTGLENVESFLAGKQFGLVWPLLVIILMLNRAAGALAGEIENGTIGTLLSQPLSRAKIYVAKYLSSITTLALFIASSVLIDIPIIAAYRLDSSIKYELVFSGVCFLVGLAVLGVGMAVSALVSERSRVYGLVGGGVMAMFVLNILSSLQDKLDFLKYTSLFYYFNPHAILVNHQVNTASVVVFAITAISGFVFGLIAFNKRDMSI